MNINYLKREIFELFIDDAVLLGPPIFTSSIYHSVAYTYMGKMRIYLEMPASHVSDVIKLIVADQYHNYEYMSYLHYYICIPYQY